MEDYKPYSEMTLEEKLAIPVSDLDVSVAAFRILERAEIYTLGELITYSCSDNDEKSLFKIRNLGRKRIEEIVNQVHELGLHFKGEIKSPEEIKEEIFKKFYKSIFPYVYRNASTEEIYSLKDLKKYDMATEQRDKIRATFEMLWDLKLTNVFNLTEVETFVLRKSYGIPDGKALSYNEMGIYIDFPSTVTNKTSKISKILNSAKRKIEKMPEIMGALPIMSPIEALGLDSVTTENIKTLILSFNYTADYDKVRIIHFYNSYIKEHLHDYFSPRVIRYIYKGLEFVGLPEEINLKNLNTDIFIEYGHVYPVLKSQNINTIGELLNYTKEEFYEKMNSLEKRHIDEFVYFIHSIGFYFANEKEVNKNLRHIDENSKTTPREGCEVKCLYDNEEILKLQNEISKTREDIVSRKEALETYKHLCEELEQLIIERQILDYQISEVTKKFLEMEKKAKIYEKK